MFASSSPDTYTSCYLADMRKLVILALALVVALTLAACGTTQPAAPAAVPPATFTVKGVLKLHDDNMRNASYDQIANNCNFNSACAESAGDFCAAGSAGYSDIRTGAQVTVTDSTGKVVGIGSLESGRTPLVPNIWKYNNYPPCLFPFEVWNVPDNGNIYGVQIAHRGTVQFTKDEATSIQVSLG